jgi:hypothetical protein
MITLAFVHAGAYSRGLIALRAARESPQIRAAPAASHVADGSAALRVARAVGTFHAQNAGAVRSVFARVRLVSVPSSDELEDQLSDTAHTERTCHFEDDHFLIEPLRFLARAQPYPCHDARVLRARYDLEAAPY